MLRAQTRVVHSVLEHFSRLPALNVDSVLSACTPFPVDSRFLNLEFFQGTACQCTCLNRQARAYSKVHPIGTQATNPDVSLEEGPSRWRETSSQENEHSAWVEPSDEQRYFPSSQARRPAFLELGGSSCGDSNASVRSHGRKQRDSDEAGHAEGSPPVFEINAGGSKPQIDLVTSIETLVQDAALRRQASDYMQERESSSILSYTETGEQVELVPGTWEDIGTNQQMQWYEQTTAEPLVHDPSGTLIYLHSVHHFLPASYETTKALVGMLSPCVLAVQCDNAIREFAESVLPDAMEIASDEHEVRKIASAYLNHLTGGHVSPHIESEEEQDLYYHKARVVAQMYSIFNLQNALEEVEQRGDPEEIQRCREESAALEGVGEVQWMAILQSGMLPQWEFHRPVLDAFAVDRPVEFIDMPIEAARDFARDAVYPGTELSAEEIEALDEEEKEQYAHCVRARIQDVANAERIGTEFGKQNMPVGLPEQLTGFMCLSVASPTTLVPVMKECYQDAPGVMKIEEALAEYCAKMLLEICENHPAVAERKHPVVLCLVNRCSELLIRRHWHKLCPGSNPSSFTDPLEQKFPDEPPSQVELLTSPRVSRSKVRRYNRRR